MNNINAIIALRFHETERRLSGAKNEIDRARTMREVSHSSSVPIPIEVRGMKNSIPGYRGMKQFAESKMEELLKKQLAELGKIGDEEKFSEQQRRLKDREWIFLRGDYPRLYRQSEMESHKLLESLKTKIDSGNAPK